jgi:phage tail tape-measure protein
VVAVTTEHEFRAKPRIAMAAVALAVLLVFSGCEGQQFSTTQKATGVGALLGAGSGAIVGAAVGHPVAGTLIGAGVGTAGGYMVGRGLQSNEEAQQQTRSQVSAQQREIEHQRREIEQLQNTE